MRYLFILAILCSCVPKGASQDSLASIQIVDRNGFSETISSKDRLESFERTDFLASQPYQKVLRVYRQGKEGGSSKVTSYHENGQIWQYLEIVNGRAHGAFREWHANGRLRLEATVIGGTPDISEAAQMTWLFDGICRVWSEAGHLVAQIPYEKGVLEGETLYFFENGAVQKRIPYHSDLIEGTFSIFDETGGVMEQMEYKNGVPDGAAWSANYREIYRAGKLEQGEYHSGGTVIAKVENGFGKRAHYKNSRIESLTDYKNGVADGEVQMFSPEGLLTTKYGWQGGKKTGEEWEYFPSNEKEPKPKLCINWIEDVIQGVVKSWYDNGVMESQREMHGNKKHGLAFAWYKDGDLMLMEEYEEGLLVKGSYYKKWEKNPVSKIENGKGTATLYTKDGHFLKKISYEKGQPQIE